MKSAILFLVFNRPSTTNQVFEAIRKAKPPRLYIAADGPRKDRPSELTLCEEARAVATMVDWPCEVHALFRDENLGCRRAVSSAIDWFFESEEEGIILEDDCLPVQSFFIFCDEMLEKYRHDKRVLHVGGTNPIDHKTNFKESYYFSRYNRIWGWATWRRAWQYHDNDIKNWTEIRKTRFLEMTLGKKAAVHYRKLFDDVYSGKIDTWDYQWFLNRLLHGFSIIPTVNLVTNIGFDHNATHTRNVGSQLASLPTREIEFPLVHPQYFQVNKDCDDYWAMKYVVRKKIGIYKIKTFLRSVFK